ncbi:glycosyltransferase [Nesterenkonia sp. AY15]|uniref:glycosyltransferase n=1 Tax=Nesterenkonia sp. AY15 TaxID=2901139 RepID=UPI001F4C83B2|nr:glycosyltransferase [Nesterenkonia sp. AY15]MCH8571310.1 glycosyltransferase [Nesterenkonia sp. AY15]
MHRSALGAAAKAHMAAARAWTTTAASSPAWSSPALTLRNKASAAHLQRRRSYEELIDLLNERAESAPRNGAAQTATSITEISVPEESEREFLGSPIHAVDDALDSTGTLPAPEAGVSRPRLPLRIGLIAGPRLGAGLFGLAEIIDIDAENWADLDVDVDLLLIGSDTCVSDELIIDSIIPHCRERSVPTAFFSAVGKDEAEDTLGVVETCDWVFAVDHEVADIYRELGRSEPSVTTVQLPVSPLLHTPLGTRPAGTDLLAFMGLDQSSTPAKVHAAQSISPLFDGALASGRPVALFRPAAEDGLRPPRWTVPAEYAPWTLSQREVPVLDGPSETAKLQRCLDVGLAVNAVANSQTLLDSQVLQLQACGTMVLATYNQGVNSYYPNVYIANTAEDVAKTLQYMDIEELRRVQGDGIRQVFTAHHGTDVLGTIARTIGLSVATPTDRVLAVADEITDELRDDIARQTHPAVALTTWAQIDGWQVGSDTAAGDFDILLPVSASRRYSPFYTADHVAAFRYQSAPITTKLQGTAEETDHAAHRHTTALDELSLSAWWRPEAGSLGSAEALASSGSGVTVYAIDHLGHRSPSMRRVVDPEVGSDLESSAREFKATAEAEKLELAVVVPIYNNGDHLRHKAFASLRRSEMFERMHILLINDGSTDASTFDTIEELAHSYPNVSAFHHGSGGSGSASRPRNTGLALSFTEFVTYLDPDDEELDDGYLVLLDELRARPEADFSLGTMAVWTHRYSVHDYHAWFAAGVEHRDGLVWPHRDTLRTLNFKPASIEALVARTEWLKGLGLVQPVGAVGQDSYFFQQLMYHVRAYVPVHRPVYTYYGAVDTSIVNVVSPKYFRKYLILELDRAQWLREVGLLEDYMEQRFETFFVSWYLEKFEKVSPDDREEAASVLREIASTYGPFHWNDHRARAFFRRY